MQEFLNQLSSNLRLIKAENTQDKMIIYCESNPILNKRVHSRKIRIVKDIPYGDKKVELHLISKKYFNDDITINKLTIAEKFDFINSTGVRTKRLDEVLLNMSKEMSAIGCERYIKESYADVSDSTIIRIIKKKLQNKL